MEQSEPEEIKSAKTDETKMNETELSEAKNPNGAKKTNDKKFPLLPVCVMLVIVVFVISGYELMWEMEELSASARSLTTEQQIRKSEKVTPKNQSSLWADFDANDTGKKHIGQTWKEHYEEEEKWQREFDRLEREQEKARKQREQEEAAKAEEARRQAAEWERIQKQNARKKAGKKTESSSSGYKDDYYKDDFDSYWDDNYDMYDDMDEAYEDWEDEYGEEE